MAGVDDRLEDQAFRSRGRDPGHDVGPPWRHNGIMEFRDGEVVRERIYFGDPWEPPSWRAQWVERFDPREPESSASA